MNRYPTLGTLGRWERNVGRFFERDKKIRYFCNVFEVCASYDKNVD